MSASFQWTLWSGPTPSADTGPAKAFNGLYYLYVEASRPSIQGDMAEYVCVCVPDNREKIEYIHPCRLPQKGATELMVVTSSNLN